MAISGVLALGLPVDDFEDRQKEAAMQSGLIRLGFELGPIDGRIGVKTRGALEQAGIIFTTVDETLLAVEDQLQLKIPPGIRVDAPRRRRKYTSSSESLSVDLDDCPWEIQGGFPRHGYLTC